MKHYIVYVTLFCTNIFQIIHPALTTREEKHTALRDAVSRALDASLAVQEIDRLADQDTRPATRLKPGDPEQPRQVSFVSFASSDHEGAAAETAPDDDRSASMAARTPRQKFRSCVQRIAKEQRRRPAISVNSPALPTRVVDDFAAALPDSRSSAHQGSDDEAREEPHHKDVSIGTDPEQPNTRKYVLIGSTSALTAATATCGVMYWLQPQRHSRMFTGFEIPAAFAAKDMLTGVASKLAMGAMAIYAWRQLHAPCRKALSATEAQLEADKRAIDADYKDKLREHKLKMKEKQDEYESKMTARQGEHERRTVLQITDVAQQVEVAIVKHRNDTQKIVHPLIEALGHAGDIFESHTTAPGQAVALPEAQATAADILHAAADQATKDTTAQAAQATRIIPPPTPKEPVRGCCGIKWPWND